MAYSLVGIPVATPSVSRNSMTQHLAVGRRLRVKTEENGVNSNSMTLFDVVHPPAVPTALALRTGLNSNFALFGLLVAIIVVLLHLKHAMLCFLARPRRGRGPVALSTGYA